MAFTTIDQDITAAATDITNATDVAMLHTIESRLVTLRTAVLNERVAEVERVSLEADRLLQRISDLYKELGNKAAQLSGSTSGTTSGTGTGAGTGTTGTTTP